VSRRPALRPRTCTTSGPLPILQRFQYNAQQRTFYLVNAFAAFDRFRGGATVGGR
jgi:hypothetical protein